MAKFVVTQLENHATVCQWMFVKEANSTARNVFSDNSDSFLLDARVLIVEWDEMHQYRQWKPVIPATFERDLWMQPHQQRCHMVGNRDTISCGGSIALKWFIHVR